MKFTVQYSEKCEQALHESTCGEAFAIDTKNKLAVFGGQYISTLVDLNDPKNILKQINIKTPLKWFVSNYEWDALGSNGGSERFLQTRYKIVEIVNSETSDTLITFRGHFRSINEAKWSPFKKNLLASSSFDETIFIWNTDSTRPAITIPSIGEPDCLAWSKTKENVLAASCNNDIRIYDIRKTNSALRYVTNAHTKKIYSLDWCSTEDILLSSSRDRNIKLWNFNMINQKFMEKVLEDFPYWKAKFTPYGLCFAVIPACLSQKNAFQFTNQNINPTNLNDKYSFSNLNESINNNAALPTNKTTNINNNNSSSCAKNDDANNNLNKAESNSANIYNKLSNGSKSESVTSLFVCKITSFNEAKIYKFGFNRSDMILNFDFYSQNDQFNIASWTRDQRLCIQSIDLLELASKELEKSFNLQTNSKQKDDDEFPANSLPTPPLVSNQANKQLSLNTNNNQSSIVQIQPITSNSSRKSSISEYAYGTPPSIVPSRILINERESFNQNDENMLNDVSKNISTSICLTNAPNFLRSSSTVLIGHDFLKKNPKCFGAKFTGLPEQFLIFSNEGLGQSQSKTNQREFESNFSSKKYRNPQNKSKVNSKSHSVNKQMAKRILAKVYLYDVSGLINMRREFGEHYHIIDSNLKKICEQNILIAIHYKRYDIVKIWELLKFVTFNNEKNFSLNPDHGKPWSCSIFGRPLVNKLIDNCIKANDIQSAAMIISKLKQHDMNIIPIASTVNRKMSKKLEAIFNNSLDQNNSSNYPTLNANFNKNLIPIGFSEKIYLNEQDSYDSDLKKHQENLGLLEPSRFNEFDCFIKAYCEILYRWGLYNKRVEMLEFVYEKPSDYDEKFECSKRCIKCSCQTNNSSKCHKCNSYLINCSICELPVNGLSTYCVICGHGGHFNHLIEWFKRHDDCPCACGCRCVDYL